eukprot:Pgem_evm1s6146
MKIGPYSVWTEYLSEKVNSCSWCSRDEVRVNRACGDIRERGQRSCALSKEKTRVIIRHLPFGILVLIKIIIL